jgi:hypothetical protein
MELCQLEGDALDEAVARALGHDAIAREGEAWAIGIGGRFIGYIGGASVPPWSPSTDWAQGGPLIEIFQIHLSGPESSVHRNGGPKAGWGPRGTWLATSWKLRGTDGRRGMGYHETSALVAAMRLIVALKGGRTATPTEAA